MQSIQEYALSAYCHLWAHINIAGKHEFKRIRKKWWCQPLVICVAAIIIVAIFGAAHPALAEDTSKVKGWLNSIVVWLLEMIAGFLGKLILAVIDLLIVVSGYNNFIDAEVVNTGWVLVRDVANMFYIFILLVIAFGTMFKLEAYSWKKLLPRFVVTAIIVNLSRTIMGVIIDFAQVIMITFVNGYAAAAGGNFAQGFNLDTMFKIKEGMAGENPDFQIVLAYLLGTVMLAIALVVVGVFLAILIGRIITIWILVILAPMAFLLGTFPKGQEYYSKWWKQFQNAVIVGPVLAFFLWLSLATMSGGNSWDNIRADNPLAERVGDTGADAIRVGSGTAGGVEKIGSFIVSIAMLMIGLQMTQELGVMGAGLAGGAASAIKSYATKAARAVAVPAAGVVATGGVGALGLGTIGAMAGGGWLGKKAVGSWKEGKGMLGMVKNVRERAGMYLEQKGVEGKGIGKLYGWKYRLGEMSEAKVHYRKERLEESKKVAAAEATEKVFEKRTGVRLPEVEMAELQLTDEFVKKFGRMEVNQQVQVFDDLSEKLLKDPNNNELRRMMGGIRSVMAQDCRVDDAAGEESVSKRLITESTRTSMGRRDTKTGLNLSKWAQQEMLARSAVGVGAGGEITDEQINKPEVQAQLSKLFQDGKTAAKNTHWQLMHIAKYNAAYKDPQTGTAIGRWEINGMQKGSADGRYVLNDETEKAIKKDRFTEVGKAGSKKMMDASPQTWFDHTLTKDADGKTRVYRDAYTDSDTPAELQAGFAGKDLATVNRNNDIQDRSLVDVLQGVMSDNFVVDANDNIEAMPDFEKMFNEMPGLMQRSLQFALGKGVRTVSGVDISGAKDATSTDKIARQIIKKMGGASGTHEPSDKEMADELNTYGGAPTARDEAKYRSRVHAGTNYHPEVEKDIKEELGMPPTLNLNNDKDQTVQAYKKAIDELLDGAIKFSSTIDKTLQKIDADLRGIEKVDPDKAAELRADPDLVAVRGMMASGLRIKDVDQKMTNLRMYSTLERIRHAVDTTSKKEK